MHYPMRRSDEQTDDKTVRELLERGRWCVASTTDEDGMPYGVPLIYVYHDGAVYLHTVKDDARPATHLRSNLRRNPCLCVTVVPEQQVVQEKIGMNYASVIAVGRAEALEGEKKRAGMALFVDKYAPDYRAKGLHLVDKLLDRVCVWRLVPDEVTGKVSALGSAAASITEPVRQTSESAATRTGAR